MNSPELWKMLDLDRLRQILANDSTLLKKYLEKVQEELPKMRSELDEAIHSKDWPRASLTIHDLKNHFRYLGNNSLANVAEQLERAIDTSQIKSINEKDVEPIILGIQKVLEHLEGVE